MVSGLRQSLPAVAWGIDAESLDKGRQRCAMVWAAFRASQLPHIEVLCLTPQLGRPTASEQQEAGTPGAAAAGLTAGSHRWCYRSALGHAQLGSPQRFLHSCASMAMAHTSTSTFYLDFANWNQVSYEPCLPCGPHTPWES